MGYTVIVNVQILKNHQKKEKIFDGRKEVFSIIKCACFYCPDRLSIRSGSAVTTAIENELLTQALKRSDLYLQEVQGVLHAQQ